MERKAAFHEIIPKDDVPLRNVVDEKTAARLEHPNTFIDPSFTPNNVLIVWLPIVNEPAILLAKIEWRVSKHRVYSVVLYTPQ